MKKGIEKLKIDWILADLCVLAIVSIILYFLISHLVGNTTLNQLFIYTATYILKISALLYVSILSAKVRLLLMTKNNKNISILICYTDIPAISVGL